MAVPIAANLEAMAKINAKQPPPSLIVLKRHGAGFAMIQHLLQLQRMPSVSALPLWVG